MTRYLLALLLCAFNSAAAAQGFPSRPVTLLVTFPAGGPTDVAGRALAEATSKYLGQPVVVENRPGATGTLGAAALVNARPDGYTVSMIPITVFRLPHMENVAFDPVRDISYVMGVSGYVFAVIVRADAPWKTMAALVAHARANPEQTSYGSHGIGGSVHLAMEELSGAQGVKFNHVPYKGSADMLTAMLGGHLAVAVDSTGAVPHVAAGKARVLAVFTEKRTGVWPDVPTMAELGYGIVSTSPYGIGVPAATPPAIVKILHDAFKKGLEDPIHTRTLEKYNQPVWYQSSEDYTKFARQQFERERKLIERIGLAKKKVAAAMAHKRIGIIMHGVTGRMGMNQHLVRSILEIRRQGGVALKDGSRLMPDPILVGRNPEKIAGLAKQHGVERWTTDLHEALKNPDDEIFFDAASTQLRPKLLKQAVRAGKHVYCEKPISTTLAQAVDLCKAAKKAGIKHGVVQDKLWLPGMMKLAKLRDEGFFGKILSVRGEFGYWVFEGDPHLGQPPAQRPSWNYRGQDGGGIILDMLCHWRYLLDNLFGEVKAVSCLGATHIPFRWDEGGKKYKATADDAAYATFKLAGGVVAHFNSSWTVRVRRDDLLTLQVDGTHGSAVAGLRRCLVQPYEDTPKPVWNPDIPQPINFFDGWREVPDAGYDNAFKVQWEMFLKHVAGEGPFRWGLLEGAKGVQLAELGLKSWRQGKWLDVPRLQA